MKRLLILILLLVTPSYAAIRTGLAPRSGVLLVASEQINDPRFAESVILITRHDLQGTAGLILTHPLGELPAELEKSLRTFPHGLFWGGPVAPLQVRGLLFGSPGSPGEEIVSGIFSLGREQLSEMLHQTPLRHGEVRVYLGYAGWAPRQLALEIARGDWTVLPADPEKLKRLPPEQLWQALLPQPASPWI